MPTWDEIKAGIFHGESGGDYDALFGFSNRPGGAFANTKLTDMTVDQAIAFADPSGPYAQHVKNKIGHVATPMGAFQIVGNTLKQAKKWAGLNGDEKMTPEIQDKLGLAVMKNQGTDAWEGYRGPREPGSAGTTLTSTPLRRVGGAGSTPASFAGGEAIAAPASADPAAAVATATEPAKALNIVDRLKQALGVGTDKNPIADLVPGGGAAKSDPLKGGPQPGGALAASAQEDAARAQASSALMTALLAGRKPGTNLTSAPGGIPPWPTL